MEPIINPWYIYWMNVVQQIHLVANICSVFGFTFAGITVFVHATSFHDFDSWKKWYKGFLATGIIGSLLVIFVPTKETMLTMLTLEYVTPDNISAVQSNVVEFVQRISEAVKEGMK